MNHIVDTVVETPLEFTVFATNPSDMVGAQRSLILWAARKIQFEKSELAEAQRNFDAAKTHKWSPTAWGKQIKKHEGKINFYRKIKMALEAGYYIVPPFPIDIFAIRTDRKWPVQKWRERDWSDTHEQNARVLPVGDGQYVSPDPTVITKNLPTVVKDGAIVEKIHWRADEWKDAEFPFKLAKAEIMEATRAAMAMKVFDQLGAHPTHRAPDPIICGQILFPDKPAYEERKAVTFFVSWWLDTREL